MYEKMREYANGLKEVLITFDPIKMREFIEKHKDLYSKTALSIFSHNDDEWLLGTMAKMIMARTDISEEYKSKAREILDGMGWDYEIN